MSAPLHAFLAATAPYNSTMRHPLAGSVLLACLALLGCAKRETAVDAGVRTQTLIVGNAAEPATIDPGLAVISSDLTVTSSLFEGLTVIDDASSEVRPGTAERWEVSPDGLRYTFHLRPAARWSNGDPVTAADFVYAFRRILAPQLASAYSYMLWPLRNAQAFNTGRVTDPALIGAEAVDATTLRLTLELPTPHLPALAAHSTWLPVHRATVEAFGSALDRTSPWTKPGRLVGNGAFVLERWTPNDRIVLARNPLYWDAAGVRLTRLVLLPTENADAEEAGFRAGQSHATFQLAAPRVAAYRNRTPPLLRSETLLSTWYLNINTTRPPLDRAAVRRALSLAIDREALCNGVLAGTKLPAASFTPPACGGYTAATRLPTDVERARRLLAEAGFPGGQGLPELEIQIRANGDLAKIAEYLQETWRRELGVRTTIAQLENKVALENQHRLAYSIALAAWIADYPDPLNFLETNVTANGNNWAGWSSPDYDRFIDEANQTLDPARRFAAFQQAESILVEELPVIPLYYDVQHYLLHPAVRGWTNAPIGIRHYQHVWLEP